MTQAKQKSANFLNLADFDTAKVDALIESARRLKAGKPLDLARGRTLGLVFLNPSLRTRVSMVGAFGWLGGTSVDLAPGQGMWKLATGSEPMLGDAAEHIDEAAGVLGRLCDVVGVRAFAEGVDWAHDRRDLLLRRMAEVSRCPVLNMESGMYHPCQSLADWLTLEEQRVSRDAHFVLSWAYHPKALPCAVPNSTLLMACQRGMRVTLLRPEGYALDPEVMARAHELCRASKGQLSESTNPAVLASAQVVYAKSWGSLAHYGDAAAEKALRDRYRDWCVGSPALSVGAQARFMHCLPVRRDVVATTALITGSQSLVLEQAENRKWAQAAVLRACLET